MFKYLNNITKNPLFTGSLIMIIGTNVASFFAYLYHLIFGRLLGPSSYSELASFISLSTIFSAGFAALGTVIMKFVSTESENNIKILFMWVNRIAIKFAILLFILLLLSAPILGNFLKVDIKIMLLFPFVVVLTFFLSIYKSFLQGLLKFFNSVVVSNADILVRLITGLVLVSLGLAVMGASLAILIGMLTSYLIAISYLKKYFKPMNKNYERAQQLFKYSLPVLIMTISITSLITTDVVLVKHYFDAHIAGIYASISTLGKIIIYGTIPIASVMFPIVSKRHTANIRSVKVLSLSFILTLFIGGSVLFIYRFFPDQAVNLLFGKEYSQASQYLFIFGFFSLFYVLDYLLVYFYLSVDKTLAAYIVPLAVVIQAVAIIINHSSLINVIYASIYALGVLFVLLVSYGLYSYRHYFLGSK
jgi:O-antigen/teichoic acid export membrane protein